MISVSVKNLTKHFGKRNVFSRISFEIKPGQVVAIVGENGSGKSTLFKILVGLLKPDEGKVVLRTNFGYCPQETILFDQLTLKENLIYFGSAYGLSEVEILQKAKPWLQEFKLTAYLNYLVSELSGGSKQKANLIIALLADPEILILDEPYQGLDYESFIKLWQIVHKFREERKSILLVTHLIENENQFDKIFELKQGGLYVRK